MGPILLSSECDVYQHHTFIVVVVIVIILLNFLEQTFMPDLSWALLNPGPHLNFTTALWLALLPEPNVL